MIKGFRLRVVLGFLVLAGLLSACVWPETEDPFERLPEEETQALDGTIYPFSVSVSTSATHRLEKENRLVAYLASDIVRLEDFEGRKVEVEGVLRTEKMREIFWVEKIKLLDVAEVPEEKKEARFVTKNFSFIYPTSWEYTTAPDGTSHFTSKNDVAKRVFLTFSVSEMSRRDSRTDTNVMIANLAGTKKITTDDADRERQEVVLFSNLQKKKYTFIFTSQFEDFERKKSFFQLLNSFIEGEEAVRVAVEEDKKKEAEQEAARLLASQPVESLVEELKEGAEAASSEPSVLEESKIETETPSQNKPQTVEEVYEQLGQEIDGPIVLPKDFKNLIDDRAFYYESNYYRFSMKVPYGYWFKNFGPSETKVAQIGFADNEVVTRTDAKFFLEIIGDEDPVSTFDERTEGQQVVLEFPRNDKSYFRLMGPASYRDAMRSVYATVKQF